MAKAKAKRKRERKSHTIKSIKVGRVKRLDLDLNTGVGDFPAREPIPQAQAATARAIGRISTLMAHARHRITRQRTPGVHGRSRRRNDKVNKRPVGWTIFGIAVGMALVNLSSDVQELKDWHGAVTSTAFMASAMRHLGETLVGAIGGRLSGK